MTQIISGKVQTNISNIEEFFGMHEDKQSPKKDEFISKPQNYRYAECKTVSEYELMKFCNEKTGSGRIY